MKFLIELMTEADNTTPCIFRVLSLLVILFFLGESVYSLVVDHKPFDPQGFGVGIGATLAGVGVALGLKKAGGPNA